jgi:hypothetical protein
MVDFGGWDMPVNYGSQIDEHHAVRTDAGMFDVSHMLPVDLTGIGVRVPNRSRPKPWKNRCAATWPPGAWCSTRALTSPG